MRIALTSLFLFIWNMVLCQESYINQTSPSPGSAQLYFFDRSYNGNTERNWKIATLPASTVATGDKLLIEIFGGNFSASSAFQQTIHLGNRNGFKAFSRITLGSPVSNVRIRAYTNSSGGVDVYFTLLPASYKGAFVRLYDGSGITNTPLVIHEDPIDVGPSPGGTMVYDSFEEVSTLIVNNNNNVGIGTNSPDVKLTVKGNIHAEEVKVDLNVPGPDYVFDEEYELASLDEINAYIKANKHLPEVPSAKEMEINGINLSEMNMLLLRKVEELTLHLIEKDQEVETLTLSIEELNKRLQALENKQ
ncbi:hypothetical protein [Marinoscillum sp.]|uniref:hypothetical protein n=1 Tax=Marinoscillum sp. TaxID=2024838 RepID=UPI003BACFD47